MHWHNWSRKSKRKPRERVSVTNDAETNVNTVELGSNLRVLATAIALALTSFNVRDSDHW